MQIFSFLFEISSFSDLREETALLSSREGIAILSLLFLAVSHVNGK